MFVIIISLNEMRAAYGPFDTAKEANEWLQRAKETYVIGSALDCVISRIYDLPAIPK
jgi:hypothetical protein